MRTYSSVAQQCSRVVQFCTVSYSGWSQLSKSVMYGRAATYIIFMKVQSKFLKQVPYQVYYLHVYIVGLQVQLMKLIVPLTIRDISTRYLFYFYCFFFNFTGNLKEDDEQSKFPNSLLTFGTGSYSWWYEHGPGCKVMFTNI